MSEREVLTNKKIDDLMDTQEEFIIGDLAFRVQSVIHQFGDAVVVEAKLIGRPVRKKNFLITYSGYGSVVIEAETRQEARDLANFPHGFKTQECDIFVRYEEI